MPVKRLDEILGLKEKDVYREIFENLSKKLNFKEVEIEGSQISEEEVYQAHSLAYTLAFPLSKPPPTYVLRSKLRKHEFIRKQLGFHPGRTINYWIYVDGKPARIIGRLDGERYIRKPDNRIEVRGGEIKLFTTPSSFMKQIMIGYIQSHIYGYGAHLFNWEIYLVKDTPELEKIKRLDELKEKNYLFTAYLQLKREEAFKIVSTAVKMARAIKKYQTSLL